MRFIKPLVRKAASEKRVKQQKHCKDYESVSFEGHQQSKAEVEF